MKTLFFYIGTPTPILETELELIKKHEKLGDSVLVLQCSGGLPNCHWNIDHTDSQCAVCRSKFQNGWKLMNLGENVELKQFPSNSQVDSDSPSVIHSVEDINRFQHDNENIGFGVTSSLVSIFRDHRFDTHKYRKEVNRGLKTAVQVYETLKSEIKEYNPDRLYLFNGRVATHLPAKLLSKKMNIEYYSYEVSRMNNSYRLLENKVNHDIDSIEEVDKIRASWIPENDKVAASLFTRMRCGIELGKTRSFTQNQQQGILPEGFSSQKRNIAIFSGTVDEYVGIEKSTNKLYEPDETAGICRILETFEADSNFYFYLRVHPHMKELPKTTSQLQDLEKLSSRFGNVHVIWPEEDIDTYALMDACEKIVTFGSTVGIEATYWGKPSILAAHAKFENFNYAYLPDTHDELVQLLTDDLKPLPPDTALRIIFSTSVEGIPFEYFKETKIKNRLTMVTLDGVEIKADLFPRLWHWFHLFPFRLKRVVSNPSLIFSKVKRIL